MFDLNEQITQFQKRLKNYDIMASQRETAKVRGLFFRKLYEVDLSKGKQSLSHDLQKQLAVIKKNPDPQAAFEELVEAVFKTRFASFDLYFQHKKTPAKLDKVLDDEIKALVEISQNFKNGKEIIEKNLIKYQLQSFDKMLSQFDDRIQKTSRRRMDEGRSHYEEIMTYQGLISKKHQAFNEKIAKSPTQSFDGLSKVINETKFELNYLADKELHSKNRDLIRLQKWLQGANAKLGMLVTDIKESIMNSFYPSRTSHP